MSKLSHKWLEAWPLALAFVFLTILPINHTAALRHLLLLGIGIAAFIAWRKDTLPPLPVKWPLLLWAAIVLLSSLWSVMPAFSLREFKLEVLLGLLAFFGFYGVTDSQKKLHLLIAALLLGIAITALMAMYRLWGIPVSEYWWDWQHNPWDWQNGFVSYSTYLAMASPFFIYVFFRGETGLKTLAAVALPLYLWAGWATHNRMFWFTLLIVVGLSSVLWFFKIQQPGDSKSKWKILFAGSLIVLATLFEFTHMLQERANATTWQQAWWTMLSHSERYTIWQFWAGVAAQHPWLGMGFGRDLPHLNVAMPSYMGAAWFAHGHNLLLNIVLQLGVLGLSVFLFMAGAFVKQGWHCLNQPKTERNTNVQWLGLTSIGVITALLVKNMTDDLFWRTDALLFWAMLGMLTGAAARLRSGAMPQ